MVKIKIRLKLIGIVLLMAAFSLLLYLYLWKNQDRVCEFMEQYGIIQKWDEKAFLDKVAQEALKYTVPETEVDITEEAYKEMQPFFDSVCDTYTSVSIYGEDDGLFRIGRAAPVLNKLLYRSILANGTDILGEIHAYTPVKFQTGTYEVAYACYYRTQYVYPYVVVSICLCVLIFTAGIFIFANRLIKRILTIKSEVLLMASGDLSHPVPKCGNDEIGVLAEELNGLRMALDDNIQKEAASRKANQDLITAMSHDLRTPLTILQGYLEVLKLKRYGPDMAEEYINRCLQKTKDIKEMTDRMFEYALVFEEAESPELIPLSYNVIYNLLNENCDFITLAGFKVEREIIRTEGSLLGDEIMLKRIFNNLFSNILKYGEKKNPVIVRCQIKSGKIEVFLINTVKAEHAEIESNRIGLKSTGKMIQLHRGQLYQSEENSIYTVQIQLEV